MECFFWLRFTAIFNCSRELLSRSSVQGLQRQAIDDALNAHTGAKNRGLQDPKEEDQAAA
jgi:hypothetical protein